MQIGQKRKNGDRQLNKILNQCYLKQNKMVLDKLIKTDKIIITLNVYQFQSTIIIFLFKHTQHKMSQHLIKQQNVSSKKQRKVICHRGLCSAILPTLYSSDLVQLDIQLTKDNQIIVFHDRNLSRITDIQKHPQFSNRFKLDNLQDPKKLVYDWWIRDFTLLQLKSLRLSQDDFNRPHLPHIHSRISTLEQVLECCVKQKKEAKSGIIRNSGLLIEIKQQSQGIFSPNDIIICRELQKLLQKFDLSSKQNCQRNQFPIIIQSFNIEILNQLKINNPQYQLYEEDIRMSEDLLRKNQNNNTIGIGITEDHFKSAQPQGQYTLKSICNNMNYQLSYWTIRDDRMSNIPFGQTSYQAVYVYLERHGVNGFITQFPDRCRCYLGLYDNENAQEQTIYQKKTTDILSCSTQLSNEMDINTLITMKIIQQSA